jgi:hypothetical protein
MYHQAVIDHARSKLESALSMELKEYSMNEVEDFAYQSRKIEWVPGKTEEILRTLPDAFQRYVFNEFHMCKINFRYWCERYAKIVDDRGQLVTLKPWKSQEALLDLVGEVEKAAFDYWQEVPSERHLQAKIPIILLKARQLGGTVISEALLAHLTFFFKHTRAGIASDHIDNSRKLWQVLLRVYDNLPGWMRPSSGVKTKANNLYLDQLDSDLTVGAGNMTNTFGQGMTVDTAHLTEVSTFLPENANAIDEDLRPAFNSSKRHHSLLILESTGQGGKGNYFHDQYSAARKGKSQFKALFLAWFRDPVKWSMPSGGIEIDKHNQALANRISREENVELSKEQLAWYQVMRGDYEERGKLGQFLQEYPSFPEEAFQTGWSSVLPIETRDRLRKGCTAPEQIFKYNEGSRCFVRCDREAWLLDKSPDKIDSHLLVWEKARDGFVYIVGVDVSYGADGGDSSAIEVLRVGNVAEPDEQVAEWRGKINPLDLARVVWLVGHMFNDRYEQIPAMVAVETNPGSPGIVTQTELMKMAYPHFYVWRKPLKMGKGWTKEVGWHTTTGTRTLLVDRGVSAIKKGALLINSPHLVSELDSFVIKMSPSGGRKVEHAANCFDDRIIGLFIALSVAHESKAHVRAEERLRARDQKNTPAQDVVQFQVMGCGWNKAMEKWEESLADW